MTPQEFINTVKAVRTLTNNLIDTVLGNNGLNGLVTRAEIEINRSDPLSMPLTQAETDHLVSVYTPLYLACLTAIELAADAFGTDAFN